MKFDKFLKRCGAYGEVFTRENGVKWLVCEGVGMIVPRGVVNLLGSGTVDEKTKESIEALIGADTDDRVELTSAKIAKDGKASDIVRVFSDPLGLNEVGICNADFGLLEKSDFNLAEVELEDEGTIEEYLLILDHDKEVVGFIKGIN